MLRFQTPEPKPTMNPTRIRTHLACLALAAIAIPAASAAEKSFQFYRWTPTKLRNDASANSIQVSEFQFYRAGSQVPWNSATVTNPGGSNPAGEVPAYIKDGLTTSKWLDFNKKGLVFAFTAATTVDAYRFATANDATERDPVSWTLEGSDDQSSWTLIDVVKNHPTTTDRQAYQSFTLPESLIPEIFSFSPTGVVVADGETTDVSWSLDRTDSASIDHGVGAVDPVSGTATIDPPDNADTTFTLTATSAGGTSTASVLVRSVTGGVVNARYVRFTPLKMRSGTMIQLADFNFSRNGTGVVPVGVTNPGGSNAPTAGEGALMAIDSNSSTKWLDANSKPLEFDFGATVEIDRYTITTANDSLERDPVRWTMEASDDGAAWTFIENMTAFDYNMPTARFTPASIPLPGVSLDPIVSASSDFSSILIGESVTLTWSSTGAATLTGSNGLGTLDESGTTTVSPTADTTYVFTATAAGGRVKTAAVTVQVANPTVTHIAYNNFDIAGSEINLLGQAAIVNASATLPQGGNVKRLRLTPDLNSTTGAAWFRYKQPLSYGFDTSFGFQFTTGQPNNGADGMAMVIHSNARRTETMPATIQENGLATGALNIGFDSYLNGGETSAARLLVLNGATVLTTVDLATVSGLTLFTTDQGADLTDMARTSSPFQVQVSYRPGDLDIRINNILVVDSLNVNLASTGALDSEGKAWVGFTARTGGSFEAHDVTNWTFTPAAGGFASWVGGFSGLANPAPGADPDGDGVINLLEYVLNGDPRVSSTAKLPTASSNAGNLIFSFVRRSESTADTSQVFEYSTDLDNWTQAVIPTSSGGFFTIAPNTPSTGLETVTVTIPQASSANGRLFGRIFVSSL